MVNAEGTHAYVTNTVSISAKFPENGNLDVDIAIGHVSIVLLLGYGLLPSCPKCWQTVRTVCADVFSTTKRRRVYPLLWANF